MMNGFLPTSLPVRLSQWWQTRDQGDSLAVAQRLADMVGIDYYPRHALIRWAAERSTWMAVKARGTRPGENKSWPGPPRITKNC